jgi:hypothetical protein
MNYSLTIGNKYQTEVYEISCQWNRLNDYYQYITDKKENSNTRLRILIAQIKEENFSKLEEQINLIKELNPNYTIACKDFHILQELLKKGYFAYLDYPVTDWETFSSLVCLKVTDIRIDSSLAFSLDKIEKFKKFNPNIKIRIDPAKSSNLLVKNRTITSFFVRPEDISLYSPYIDICEFNVQTREEEEALYDIYRKQFYPFNLNLLIKQLDEEFLNSMLDPDFGKNRINCHQVCQEPGSRCHYCQTLAKNAKIMYTYIKDKKQEEQT